MESTATGPPAWTALLGRPDLWYVVLGMVAGLVIFGALRGAGPGWRVREPRLEGGPTPGRRDRLAASAAFGLVLIAQGAWIAPSHGIPWSLPAFGLGFGLLILAGRGARAYRHGSPTLRRVFGFSETALTGSALAGLLMVANVAAFRYGNRPMDLTRERVYSLAPETARLVRSLERPLRLTSFYYGRNPQSANQAERVRQLLTLIQAESPERVMLDTVNFQGDPVRAEELLRRVPAAGVATGGVLVELGEGEAAERIVVRHSEMFGEPTLQGADNFASPISTDFRGEYAVTAALIRLRDARRPKLYMTIGHGEAPSNELDLRRRGTGLFRARLADVGFDVNELDLSVREVPEDAAVLAVLGPRSAFSEEEARRLDEYLKRGGRAMLMLGGRGPIGLENLLRSHRIELVPALVLETRGALASPSPTVAVRVSEWAEHPILRPLAGQSLAVASASPIRLLDDAADSDPDSEHELLLRTSPAAWGETRPDATRVAFDPDQDVPGPINVGVAVSRKSSPVGPPESERPLLVLFSSADLADNRFGQVVGYETNLDLALNAANWLRGGTELPEIAPRTRTVPRLDPDPNLQLRLILMPTLLALSLILGLATAVLVSRRS